MRKIEVMDMLHIMDRMSGAVQFGKKGGVGALHEQLQTADAVAIGAGAGLSTAAGMTYSGKRFDEYFSDFAEKYGIRDMYSGGFFPFPTENERWAWWSRMIYVNRYTKAPSDVYPNLLKLVQDKNYFVLTTNVDHQFQMAGFDKDRLFYTQGDYGLFQSVNPAVRKTYDNAEQVMAMMAAQGFVKNAAGVFVPPEDQTVAMTVADALIPVCPDDGSAMTMNLRCDDTFVEDDGWHTACQRYNDFIDHLDGQHVLYLELGDGMNTPVIIKYPFWRQTAENPQAFYAAVNLGEAACPERIADRSICLNADIGAVLRELLYRKDK